MSKESVARGVRTLGASALLLVISGCATVSVNENLSRTQNEIADFTDSQIMLNRSADDQAHAEAIVDQLLAAPLSKEGAVQMAMANSAAFQAVLAQNMAETADAAQSGRISNPVFNFERVTVGTELEIGRLLSFGLLDLVTLPQRQRMARSRVEIAQINLTNAVIEEVLSVREAWVKAVAATQMLDYARQVFDSAEASAELAERMERVGNFSRLDRARQQSFYNDAGTQLAAAQHAQTSALESLIRKLGLSDAQAERLELPERLPEVPVTARSPEMVSQVASDERLDVKLAAASLTAAARAQGINNLTSFTDIEAGVRRDTVFDDGERSNPEGYEIDIRIPLFDWGGLQREAMNARTLAAANRLEATRLEAASSLREAYSAYRTAHEVARLYEEEIIPLQELIAEESVLRYNGMLIGVFELLADSRRQITTVQGAIDASQQFWIADAALQASIIGKPTMTAIASAGAAGGSDAPGH